MSDHPAITIRHSTAAISERISVDISLRSLTNGPLSVATGFSLSWFQIATGEGKPRQAEACAYFRRENSAASGTRSTPPGVNGWQRESAPQREPRTAPRAVDSHGLSGVVRAGRIKLAGARHQRRKKSLVHAHGKEQRARREAHVFGPVFALSARCSGWSAAGAPVPLPAARTPPAPLSLRG